jgi:hypothetical protein
MAEQNENLYVGVVIDGPQIDGSLQDLFDTLSRSETATLDVDGMRFKVQVTRVSQKGI